jgi:O-antigen ligase
MSWANKAAYFLLIFTVIFTALAYGAVHQPVIALFYVLTAAMVVLWAIDCFVAGTVRASSALLQLPLYAAAAYGFIQVIPFGWTSEGDVANVPRTISLDQYATQTSALHFLALALLFSVTLVLIDRVKRIRRLVTTLTVFGFIFAFFAILQGVLSPTKIYGIYERQFAQPYGSFVNRHNFAAYMEMTLALPLSLVLTGSVKRDQRLLYLTAVLLMAVALFLSGSRGGLIAMIAEVIVMVMITAPVRRGKKLAVRLALGAALLVAVAAGTIFVGGESSLTRIAETASSKDVSVSRTQIWTTTLEVITHNLPFGVGLGALGVAYTNFDTFSGLERVEQAHNDYLQIVSDAGVIGMLIGGAFLYFLIRTFTKNMSTGNTYRRAVVIGAGAGIFGVLVHSLFDFVLHTTAVSVLFFVLLSLLVNSGFDYEDDIPGDEPRRHRRGSVHPLRQ